MTTQFTAEAILFTIQSALKLEGAIRRAYADSIKRKELVLPLPDMDTRPINRTIRNFFRDEDPVEGGAQFLELFSELKALQEDYENIKEDESDPRRKKYLAYYQKLKPLTGTKEAGGDGLLTASSPKALASLMVVRQWEAEDPSALSPLQLLAATIVEIGIDYYTQVPTHFSSNNPYGRALKSFLAGFDDLELDDKEDFKRLAKTFVPRLFISASTILGELSNEITDDEKFQTFIRASSSKITGDIYRQIKKGTASVEDALRFDQQSVVEWGQFLFRSTVKNAGDEFLGNPGGFLGTNEGASKIIQSTGTVLLDLLIENPGEKINFRKAFTNETLDLLMQQSFGVIAEHPELLSGKQGIRNIVVGVSESLEATLAGTDTVFSVADLVPELARLVLEHTAGNLDQLWNIEEEDGEHLLLLTVRQLLEVLALPPAGADRWRPRLTKPQLLDIAGNLLGEVVHNPGWILAKVNDKPLLTEVLEAVFGALRQLPAEARINFDTVEMIIRLSLRTVAASELVLQRIEFGDTPSPGEQEDLKTILQHALDIVFAYTFDKKETDRSGRIQKIVDLVEFSLDFILEYQAEGDRGLLLLQLILFADGGVDFTAGFNRRLANEIIESGLKVLASHPELVSRKTVLQNIVGEVSQSLHEQNIRQPGLVLELVRLVMNSTAKNAALILPVEEEDPKFLLVQAFREIISVMTEREGEAPWKPRLTGPQLLVLTESLLDTVIFHPEWILPHEDDRSDLGELMGVIFEALQQIPEGQRLSVDTLELILSLSIRTAIDNQAGDEEVKVIIKEVIDLILNGIFRAGRPVPPDWEVRLVDLLEFFMERIIAEHPNARGLLLVDLILEESTFFDSPRPFDRDSAERLKEAALTVISYHPDLVSRKPFLQSMIRGMAGILKDAGRTALIPEVIRFSLEIAAGRLEMLVAVKEGRPLSLLALAVREVLLALAAAPEEEGRWSPRLSDEQLLDVLQLVLQSVAENPRWVSGDEEAVQTVFTLVIEALEAAPPSLSFDTFLTVVEAALRAVNSSKQWIIQSSSGGQIILQFSLQQLILKLYDEENHPVATWTLTQIPNLNAIIEAFFSGLSERSIVEAFVEEALATVEEAIEMLENNKGFLIEDLLARLESGVDIEDSI